jgi:hypothetical protein
LTYVPDRDESAASIGPLASARANSRRQLARTDMVQNGDKNNVAPTRSAQYGYTVADSIFNRGRNA